MPNVTRSVAMSRNQMLTAATGILASVLLTTVASAEPRGSYRRSCENIQEQGPILSAECQTMRGNFRRSSLDMRECNDGRVSNINGRLTCDGASGYGDYARGHGYGGRGDFGYRRY